MTVLNRDPDTGRTTQTVTINAAPAGAWGLTDHHTARAAVVESLRVSTSVEAVIGADEQALRDGRWRPENAAELLQALDHLRRCLAPDVPRETLAVAALRVGRLHTEAVAKGHWPTVTIGRTHRRQMREAGQKRQADTRSRRDNLARLVAQYRKQHPSATNTAIARAINARWPRPVSLEALRKQIARLK